MKHTKVWVIIKHYINECGECATRTIGVYEKKEFAVEYMENIEPKGREAYYEIEETMYWTEEK